MIVKCVQKGRCRLRIAGSGLMPTCSSPILNVSLFHLYGAFAATSWLHCKAHRSWSYGEAVVWYSKPEWQSAATGGNQVQGRQPQHGPLELAWRHISNSWLGPSLHSGGVRTILCFFLLCVVSYGFWEHGSSAVTCTLKGSGWKMSPKSSSLPPGLWVEHWFVLCSSTLQGIVRALTDPKMQSNAQLCFFPVP